MTAAVNTLVSYRAIAAQQRVSATSSQRSTTKVCVSASSQRTCAAKLSKRFGAPLAVRQSRQIPRSRKSTVTKAIIGDVEEDDDIKLVIDDGKPFKASDGLARDDNESFAVVEEGKWECRSCQYVYEDEKGDPEFPVSPGTKFAAIDASYQCPVCGADKSLFESKSKVVSGFAVNQGYGLGANSMSEDQKSLLIYGSLALFFALFIAGYQLD